MVPEDKLTGVERDLVQKLREVWNDDEFVTAIRLYLKQPEEKKALLTAMVRGEVVGSDEISLFALEAHNRRLASEVGKVA